MNVQVRLAPATAAQRCAACHDGLDHARRVCGGCRVALHVECAAGLAECPTLGCRAPSRGRRPRPRGPAPAIAGQGGGALATLAWVVPGLLTLVWPLSALLLLALSGCSFYDEGAVLLCGAAGLLTGPLVGHLVLAPLASRRSPGPHHSRAAIAGGATFLLGVMLMLALA